MALEVISVGSDNLVRLDALTNASDGTFVNDATVSFVLKDATGAVVQNTTTMTFISNGRYEGTLTHSTSAGLTENGLYAVEITATRGLIQLFRKLSCIAKTRSSK
jgi:hypothetical protein